MKKIEDFFSKRVLENSRAARVVLHILVFFRGGKVSHMIAGIAREFH